MGALLQVVSGRVTNPGAALTALTADTGDSFQVFAFDSPGQAFLLDAWALSATAGIFRVRSPRLHDNVQGLRNRILASTPQPLLPDVANQPLYSQDVLILEQSGGGAETDMATILNYYTDVPGSNARLFRWEDIVARIRNVIVNEVALTTGATLGDYGGQAAINASFDLLKANTDYAILGYQSDVSVCTVGIRGPDTSNFRVGGPGTNLRIETRDWFVDISRQNGLPLIPVVNAANKGATLVDVVHSAAGATVNVGLVLAELAA